MRYLIPVIMAITITFTCHAGTIYVDGNAKGQNNGSSWTDAFNNLHDALANTAGGDVIWVAQGTYRPPVANVSFVLKSDVTLYGGFEGNETVVVERNWANNKTILSGDIAGNDTFEDSESIADNSHNVVIGADGTVLDGFVITGGIANYLTRHEKGGGMFNEDINAIVRNCVFIGNWAIYGGAIYNDSSHVQIINCLFSGNGAGRAGAIYNNESIASIINCTFSQNTATDCGGIYNSASNPVITNCIVYGNPPGSICNVLGSQPFISYSDIEGCGGSDAWIADFGINNGGNIDVVPNFSNPPGTDGVSGTIDDDLSLLTNSPCINTEDTDAFPPDIEKDLDGWPRISGGQIDMGAYEYQQNSTPVADAGPNQVAYAWIDGIAEVTLDGSASYDPDGDELEYFWNWTIDGNYYEANGLSPTIELPVGEHQIELIVNDGFKDSEPNYTDVTVVGPIKGTLKITPQMIISRQCPQKRIMAKLILPAGITRDQIDANQKLTLYPGGIEATNQIILPCYTYGGKRLCIFAYFDRDEALDAIGGNRLVKVYTVGKLKSGQFLYGSDIIRIFNPSRWPRWGNMRQWFGHWNQFHPCAQNRR